MTVAVDVDGAPFFRRYWQVVEFRKLSQIAVKQGFLH